VLAARAEKGGQKKKVLTLSSGEQAHIIRSRRVRIMAEQEKLREEIVAANEKLMAAAEAQDAAGLAALYTKGGQVLPPNSDFVTGREAIQSLWQGVMDSGIRRAALETVEVEGRGKTAFEVGKYTLYAEGDAVADQGKYMIIWKKKKGGVWKLHRDMFNSSMPAA
jgi:uncharacterized protein (TIGR02246 family)